MRTTVSISDELLAAARERAQATGQTLGGLVEAGLRRELASRPSGEGTPVPVFRGGTGPRPGIDVSSNAALREALGDGLPLDRQA